MPNIENHIPNDLFELHIHESDDFADWNFWPNEAVSSQASLGVGSPNFTDMIVC